LCLFFSWCAPLKFKWFDAPEIIREFPLEICDVGCWQGFSVVFGGADGVRLPIVAKHIFPSARSIDLQRELISFHDVCSSFSNVDYFCKSFWYVCRIVSFIIGQSSDHLF